MKNLFYLPLLVLIIAAAACNGGSKGEKASKELTYQEMNPITWDTSVVVSPKNVVKEVKKWFETLEETKVSVLIDTNTYVVLGKSKQSTASSNRVYGEDKVVAAVIKDTAELKQFRDLVQIQRGGDLHGFDQAIVLTGMPFEFREGLALAECTIEPADSLDKAAGTEVLDVYNVDESALYKPQAVLNAFEVWDDVMVKVQGTCSKAMAGNKTTFEDRSVESEDHQYPEILAVTFKESFKGDGSTKERTVKGRPYLKEDRRTGKMEVRLGSAVWVE